MHSKRIHRCLAAVLLAAGVSYGQIAAAQLSEQSRFSAAAGSGRMLGSPAVGNVDDDPELEIVSNGPSSIEVFDADGSSVCTFSTVQDDQNRAVNAPVSLADIDGDGIDEIVFATGYESSGDYTHTNSIFALEGDCSVIWEQPVDRTTYSTPESGYQTISGSFYYDGALHDQLPEESTFSMNVSALPVTDLDGDGADEVAAAIKIRPEPVQDSNPNIEPIWGFAEWGTVGESWSGGTMIVNAATGEREYIYHICQLVEAGLAVGTVNPDKPGPALFVLNDSDSIAGFHMTDPHGFAGAGNLIGAFGKNQRLHSGSYHQPNIIHAADITGDGLAELLYTTDYHNLLWQGHFTILDSYGRIIYRRWGSSESIDEIENHWPNAVQAIPLNVGREMPVVALYEGSTQLELLEWDGTEMETLPGWPVSFDDRFPSPPAVGDVDGDGEVELVVTLYNARDLSASGAVAVLGLDGTVEDEVSFSEGAKNPPTLADVDGDGALEVTLRTLGDEIVVLNTGSGDTSILPWQTEYGAANRTGAYGKEMFAAGTPRMREPLAGYGRAAIRFDIDDDAELAALTVLRRGPEESNYTEIASLVTDAREYEDNGLENGALYRYRVRAEYGDTVRLSAPVAVEPMVEGNLTMNPGFERNGDCGWDKWYTGDIPWENMRKTEADAQRGAAAMEINLSGIAGGNSSIKQWNQYGVIDAQIQVEAGTIYSFGMWIKTDLDLPSEHWIEWGSDYDKFRHDPENDPVANLEWPNYFSTHVVAPAGAGEWLYSNRTFTLPEGFTAVAPRHRYDLEGTPQGTVLLDNVTFRKVGTEEADAETILPFGATWRYLAGSAEDDWFAADFDDTAWTEGTAKFGAGSGPDDVVTEVPQFEDTLYFRTTFEVTDIADIREWVVSGSASEGTPRGIAALYINGTWIPIQDPGLSDGAGNSVQMLDLSPFISSLNDGQNTLAVRYDNEYKEWDDVAFDMQLKIRRTVPLADPHVVRDPPSDSDDVPEGTGDAGEEDEKSDDGCGCTAPGRPASSELIPWIRALLSLP